MKKTTFLLFSLLLFAFSWQGVAQSYCVPEGTNSGRYIDSFSTTGGIENISNQDSGFSDLGYGDHTAMTVEAYVGEDLNFEVDIVGGTAGFRVWVDWNQDGEFDAADEVAFQSNAYSASHSGSFTIPADAVEGTTRMRIVSHWLSSNGSVDPCEVDFEYGEFEDYTVNLVMPTCPTPSGLAVSDVTISEATLEWTENGSATEWKVLYGETGFDPETEGTTIMVNDDSETTLSGLDTNTNYAFYVAAVCGIEDESSLAGPYTFRTSCGVVSVPYLLDFEDATIPELPSCTSQQNLGEGNDWETALYTNNGLNGTVLKYGYNTNNDANVWFFMGGIELEAGVNYQISYKYFAFETYPESLKIAYGTSADAAAMTEEIADYPSLAGAGDETNYFNVEEDGVYYFGLHAYSEANQHTMYFDDIEIKEAPSCIAPSGLYVDNVGATSADLGWVQNGTAATWNIEYGVQGFEQGSGTTEEVTSNPYTLEDLQSNTTYEFYVQADCAEGGESAWSGPFSFTTTCVAGNIPFEEGFEEGYIHGENLGGCWSQESLGGSNSWVVNNTETDYNRTPRSGDWNIYLRYGNEAWMFYPIELNAGVTYDLEFYARQDEDSGATVQAGFGTTNSGAAMTSVISETEIIDGDYQELSGSFTPDVSGVYYLGIKGETTFSPWYLSIDDISVTTTTEVCDAVTDVEVTEIAETIATISWTASATAEEGYVVAVYEAGADMDADTAVVTETLAEGVTTLDVEELTPDTEYDVYVTAVCGEDNSVTSEAVTFTTEPTANVGDFDVIKLTVYPNPVNTNLNISAAKVIDEVQVYNILGQRVMTHKSNNTEVTLDVTELPTANYILKVRMDGIMSTVKFIKK